MELDELRRKLGEHPPSDSALIWSNGLDKWHPVSALDRLVAPWEAETMQGDVPEEEDPTTLISLDEIARVHAEIEARDAPLLNDDEVELIEESQPPSLPSAALDASLGETIQRIPEAGETIGIQEAETAQVRERKAAVEAVLAEAQAGKLHDQRDGIASAVFRIARYPEPQTVELLVDDTPQGAPIEPDPDVGGPLVWELDLGPGGYVLMARATDAAELTTDSEPIAIGVDQDPPVLDGDDETGGASDAPATKGCGCAVESPRGGFAGGAAILLLAGFRRRRRDARRR